jgi:hypothetical protein
MSRGNEIYPNGDCLTPKPADETSPAPNLLVDPFYREFFCGINETRFVVFCADESPRSDDCMSTLSRNKIMKSA